MLVIVIIVFINGIYTLLSQLACRDVTHCCLSYLYTNHSSVSFNWTFFVPFLFYYYSFSLAFDIKSKWYTLVFIPFFYFVPQFKFIYSYLKESPGTVFRAPASSFKIGDTWVMFHHRKWGIVTSICIKVYLLFFVYFFYISWVHISYRSF